MQSYCRSHLRTLEDEAVHILRELAAERERPCLLFSGGKDSTRITRIEQLGEDLDAAFAPMSVTIHLEDDLDVSRGDLLCRPNNQPLVSQDLDAMVCWMSDRPLLSRGRYAIKHTTRWGRAVVNDILYRLDVNTGHRDEVARELKLNDLGRIQLRTTTPVLYDPYRRNRTTGSFILVDETTNSTVAAGMLLAPE